MKIFWTVFIVLMLPVISVAQDTKIFTISNPTNTYRRDELIVLKKGFIFSKFGKTKKSPYYIIKSNKNIPQVVQFDDLDGDEQWDEAVFLTSLQPMEKVTFAITGSNTPMTIKATVRAHVRQMHKLPDESFGPSILKDTMPYNNQPTDFTKQKLPPYLTEGPGWENDKVGFRKYFDVRNANDIWGKVTNRMMLDVVGVDPNVIYHHFDSTWGMDILKVGKSLGAGGLALQANIDGRDSLVRFGSNVEQITYEQVADGPIRAIFRIKYRGWKIGVMQPIDAMEEISIWGGQYFYQNTVTVTGAPSGAKLVTGLNNFYVKTVDSFKSKATKVLCTWGRQSENGDNLGMAVMVPATLFTGFGQTPDAGSEVLNTYTVSEKILQNQPVLYRYYVGWQKTDNRFAEKAGFESFIKAEAMKAYSLLKYQ